MDNLALTLKAETSECDFKESVEIRKPKSWLKTVSAFANSFGGSLYFGLSDDGSIKGLKNIKIDSELISELIKSKIEPTLEFTLKTMSVEDKNILQVSIPIGKNTPYYYSNNGAKEIFFRMGNESIPATNNIISELVLRGTHLSFDAINSLKLIKEATFLYFNAFYKQITGKSINSKSQIDYASFGFFYSEEYLNYCGALFADQYLVFNSRIFATRWNGFDKIAHFEGLASQNYEGNVLKLLQDGESFIARNSFDMWRKNGHGHDTFYEYPTQAIHEALINALVHRDYLILGSEIHIDIYDDRMEIVSPGGMMDGKFIQNLNIQNVASNRRNPFLCNIFSRLKLIEARGSGLLKIYKSYPEDNKPRFFSNSQSFFVILPNLNFGKKVDEAGKLVIDPTVGPRKVDRYYYSELGGQFGSNGNKITEPPFILDSPDPNKNPIVHTTDIAINQQPDLAVTKEEKIRLWGKYAEALELIETKGKVINIEVSSNMVFPVKDQKKTILTLGENAVFEKKTKTKSNHKTNKPKEPEEKNN